MEDMLSQGEATAHNGQPLGFFITCYFIKNQNDIYKHLHGTLLLLINKIFNKYYVLVQGQDFEKSQGLGQGQVKVKSREVNQN